MSSVKKIVRDIADHLPEEATFDDAMYALYVRQKLEEGLRDIDEGPHLYYTQEEWKSSCWASARHEGDLVAAGPGADSRLHRPGLGRLCPVLRRALVARYPPPAAPAK